MLEFREEILLFEEVFMKRLELSWSLSERFWLDIEKQKIISNDKTIVKMVQIEESTSDGNFSHSILLPRIPVNVGDPTVACLNM